jgi:hypothetical protein
MVYDIYLNQPFPTPTFIPPPYKFVP